MTEELRACPDPWCPTNEAGAPEFGDQPICVYQQYGGYAVQCSVCELSGPCERTAADAIAAWNARPTPADAGEVREKVARALFKANWPADCQQAESYDEQTEGDKAELFAMADAAITALLSPTILVEDVGELKG